MKNLLFLIPVALLWLGPYMTHVFALDILNKWWGFPAFFSWELLIGMAIALAIVGNT